MHATIRLVAWVVSGCQSSIHREEFTRQLSRYIQVDIYGKCGNQTSPDGGYWEMLRRDYKFYLALENTWCPDYVSEKFYRTLQHDAVPITLSPAVDYSRFAPPGSYINAFDFGSVKDLADYLLLLNRTDSLYAAYFEWKRHYRVAIPAMGGWCDLCRMAHDENLPAKVYPDIKQWWMEDAKCITDSSDYF